MVLDREIDGGSKPTLDRLIVFAAFVDRRDFVLLVLDTSVLIVEFSEFLGTQSNGLCLRKATCLEVFASIFWDFNLTVTWLYEPLGFEGKVVNITGDYGDFGLR